MKKIFSLVLGILLAMPSIYSQPIQTWIEDFDGTVTFTAQPSGSWVSDVTYHLPGSSLSNPKSYLGLVPPNVGDTTILETGIYDCGLYDYVTLQFSHICKVSPLDRVRIEYRTNAGAGMGRWDLIPTINYLGTASNFRITGFNAASYSEWRGDNDSIFPTQSWWKEELFDIGIEARYTQVQFRFMIIHGQTPYTQASYGWLIDNFKLKASIYQIELPVVKFVDPLVKDTVYRTGPWKIKAKVKTQTNAPIVSPSLTYTAMYNGQIVNKDTLLMNNISGDSLWAASIPQFEVGTEVIYSIEGHDTVGNSAKATSGYVIAFVCSPLDYGSNTIMRVPQTGNNSYTINSGIIYPDLGPASGNSGGYSNSCNGNIVIYPSIPGAEIQITGTYALEPCCDYVQIYDGVGTNGTLLGRYGNPSTGAIPTLTSTTGALTIRFYSDPSTNTASNSIYWGFIFNVISTVDALVCRDNSVSIESIDLPDTVICLPGEQVPLVFTIKNRGKNDLASATIYYSINGKALSYTWQTNQPLTWDMNRQDTIYYTHTLNQNDEIKVWIKMPNGFVDNIIKDDTCSKEVYFSADIQATFINPPADTVYSTGRYEIKAKITSVTGMPVSPILLYVVSTHQDTTVYDTLNMLLDMSDTLWKVTLPHYRFGSNVVYSIEIRDTLGNDIGLSESYYIKRMSCTIANSSIGGNAGMVTNYFYTGNVQTVTLPAGSYQIEAWGADGGTNPTNTGIAGKGGYSKGDITLQTATKLYIYVGGKGSHSAQPLGGFNSGNGTTKTNLANSTGGGGASDVRILADNLYNRVLVAGGGGGQGNTTGSGGDGGGLFGDNGQGSATNAGIGGTQTAAGVYPGGNDAKAASFGEGGDGPVGTTGGQGGGGWYGGSFGVRTNGGGAGGSGYVLTSTSHIPAGYFATHADYYMNNTITVRPAEIGFVSNPITTGNGNGNGHVKMTTLFLLNNDAPCLEHSVALESINNFDKDTVIAGVPVPVHVTIRNKGVGDLDSCYLNWSLNGNLQSGTTVYKGKLMEDFTDTITLTGNYTPTEGQGDIIRVWVRLPNSKTDSVNYDDTITLSIQGCSDWRSGIKTVGTGGNFTTINSAINAIKNCRLTNDLTLQLNGNFAENVVLENISNYMNGYTLTITSHDGNPANAIISPSTGVGITLGNTRDIVLKDITVNVASGSPSSTNRRDAIQFTDACTNIVVRGCKLLAQLITNNTYSAPVYKASATGIVDSIFFINNTLDGGYYGFYFHGGTGNVAYGNHVVFDSNTLSNNSTFGTYPRYVDFISCSYNTILSRKTNTSATWTGLYMYYANGPLIGNRIIQRSNSITSPYGIYLYAHNYYPSTTVHGRTPICNNEIILNVTNTSITTTTSGIYAYYTKSDILHNSIYISGTGMTSGIYIYYLTSGNDMVIKNNNIVTTSSFAYPVYFDATGVLTNYDIDYNNYYAPVYIGYYGAPVATMSLWQQQIATDLHSVNVLPDFIDLPDSLHVETNWQLLCNSISPVMTDINGNPRNARTTLGCYHGFPSRTVNATLTEITGLKEGVIFGKTDTVKVTVYNTGTTTLNAINLEWAVNGVSQKTGGDNYTLSLNKGDAITITLLGNITYTKGSSEIKIWINSVNGVGLDDYNYDDTISKSVLICANKLGSSVSIGTSLSSDYRTFGQMWNDLQVCGASGDLTVVFEPGIYSENIDLSTKALYLSNYMLTITSTTHNANDVIICPSLGSAGVLFGNSRNITLKDITVDASVSKSNAIQFTAACTNIVVKDCRLLADPVGTSETSNPVYKPVATGIVDSVFFINDTLNGGYYGFYFYGGTGVGTGAYGTRVVFDNNVVSNSYYYGTHPYYVDFTSCSYNTILSRASGSILSTWYGLSMYYVNGPAIGNRIIQRSNNIISPYGIYLGYYNSYPTATVQARAPIVNNEIILSNTSTSGISYGIYVVTGYTKTDILHNSVYISGNKAGRGIYITNTTTNNIAIKNNNIVLTSTTTTAYPVYFSDTGNVNLYDIDYNNYYVAQDNIGYYNVAQTLEMWKNIFPTDKHSGKINPSFIDPTITGSLELSSYPTTLSCPAIAGVQGVENDIRGIPRLSSIYMGAYTQIPPGYDLMLLQVTPWNTEAINNQFVQLNVDVKNLATLPVTKAVFGWSVNGVLKTPVHYTFNPPLISLEQINIKIDTFQIANADTFNIVVWVDTINEQPDMTNWNDTARTWIQKVPLTEFVPPFIGDTTDALSFDVSVKIREGSGVMLNPLPKLYVYVEACNASIRDTLSIPMIQEDNKWMANIPKQYYESKVIYELHVSDTIGNNVTLRDSTYIKFGSVAQITDYPYTGSVQTLTLPAGRYQIEAWGADGGTSPTNNGVAGKGGYSKGIITLQIPTVLHIYVGGVGGHTVQPLGGFNSGNGTTKTNLSSSTGGGGASDIRILTDNLYNRILVAGGGGGQGNATGSGGDGGGLLGDNGQGTTINAGVGGTQTAHGVYPGGGDAKAASFGEGGDGPARTAGGQGGGGWYGGSFGDRTDGGGAGGSGYVLTSSSHIPTAYFASYANYYMNNAMTVRPSETGFVANPMTTGNGHVRITSIFGAIADVYSGNNLSIINVVSPVNNETALCADITSPIEIELLNLGENDYDFTKDNITIGYQIINPRGIIDANVISIDNGELLSGESRIVELIPARTIIAGQYIIKAWVTSVVDNFSCDDTLNYVYTSVLRALPFDEDFSSVTFDGFLSTPIRGAETWELYTDINNQILPPTGHGRVARYTGSFGTVALLSTRQLDLKGVAEPKLQFWYYHDTTVVASDWSYTNVNIVVDGVVNTEMILYRQGNMHGWKQYTVYLKPYINAQCVLVQFEAMNKYNVQSAQYIGHVTIISMPDVAVSEIIISPEASLCDMDNKTLKVVLKTIFSQPVNFSKTTDSLIVDIPKHSIYKIPLEMTMMGYELDTVQVDAKINLPKGVYTIKAYLQSPVDGYPSNDTATFNIDIRSQLSLTANSITQGLSCFRAGDPIQQDIILRNTGNINLKGIELELRTVEDYPQTLKENNKINLAAGDTIEYKFNKTYLVPNEPTYFVQVRAYLICDDGSKIVDTMHTISECVQLRDLEIVEISNPFVDSIGRRGATESITVSIKNTDAKPFYDVVLMASIEDEQERIIATYQDTIPHIDHFTTASFTFSKNYTVPDDSIYRIWVYLNSVDIYPENDTVYIWLQTKDDDSTGRGGEPGISSIGSTNSFTLSQNIPNPANAANNSTRIDYSVPEAGEVIFHVHSISGQLLYSQTINTKRGTNSIELNTSTFASGVYFYSMEYKGQRLVKQLIISN
jgi:hypothetical protein